MRRIFWGFCRNWFLMSPLHYLSGRSDFGFEYAEIFLFEKRLPTITDTGSRLLSVSVIWGVTPRIVESGSRRLPASLIRWVSITDTASRLLNFFKRKLSVSMIRRVVDSPNQWYGESPTPRIVESESRRLRVSPIRRVDDSAYRWIGESTTPPIGDTGSRYWKKKISLASIFSTLNR
jgi:hypothetical protein